MSSRLALGFTFGALLVARVAAAQEIRIGYTGLPNKATGESGTGIQISDGVLMHVGAGAEAGYDTNVFYRDSSQGVIGSGIIRTTGYAEITNASRTGAVPSGMFFDARAALMYRYYTSGDQNVTPYRNALMPGAGLAIGLNPGQTVSFGIADTYQRFEDPPYNPGQTFITRDNNLASAEMRWAPGGGRITATLRYNNMVDVFEHQLREADSDTNEIMADAAWKWLPKTAVFLQVRQGYIFYLNDVRLQDGSRIKYSSYPLHVLTGLRGLITERISAILTLGYSNAFYSAGAPAQTGGFLGSSYLELQGTYRPTMLSRIVAGYIHDSQNSVISTFYYDDQIYASYVQQLAGRFALDLSGRYHHKNYQGYRVQTAPTAGVAAPPILVPRTDNTFEVGATLDYFVRNWAYAGVGYSVITNSSDVTVQGASVSYLKQQLFARLGLTY